MTIQSTSRMLQKMSGLSKSVASEVTSDTNLNEFDAPQLAPDATMKQALTHILGPKDNKQFTPMD